MLEETYDNNQEIQEVKGEIGHAVDRRVATRWKNISWFLSFPSVWLRLTDN
jgi:hypothetical protein